jgi:fxsA protein
MPFIAFLFAVFLFIYVELSLLVWVGSHLGILMLILLLIGSSLLGITLMRVRGWYSLTRIKQQLTQGQLPTDALFGSLRWLVAGILFVIPGFVTDILACVLLSPLGRYLTNTFIADSCSSNKTSLKPTALFIHLKSIARTTARFLRRNLKKKPMKING